MRLLKKRGQVSIEYLAIFSVAALMMIPIIIIFAFQSSTIEADVAQAQATNALVKIVDSAEEIYFQGPPAKKTMTVHFPKGVTNVTILENSISIMLQTVEGEYEIFETTSAKLSGEIKIFEGPHTITFNAEENQVLINDK